MKKRALPTDPRGQELVKLLAREQYERWLNQEIESLLIAHFKEVTALLLKDLDSAGARRRAQLFTRVERILSEGYDKASSLSAKELLGYTGVEAQAAKAQLHGLIADSEDFQVSMGNLTRAELKAIVRLPIQGLNLGEWWDKQAADMSLATKQQIQLGLTAGEGPDVIARRIVPKASQTTPAVWRRARNNANILVRTSLTTVQNTAAFEAYQTAGDDVTDSYRYVSARDSRVTPICRALDGNVYKYKDPQAKRPPQHIRCRSTIVPVINFDKLGLPEPDPTGPLGFRSYADWLREQPAARQDDLLGPGRAQLWRNGTSLQQMVDTDNRVLTLKQLKERITQVER